MKETSRHMHLKQLCSSKETIQSISDRGAWLAQSVKHTVLDLGIVSPSSILGRETHTQLHFRHHGGSVKNPTLALSSGHDLLVRGFEPCIRLHAALLSLPLPHSSVLILKINF